MAIMADFSLYREVLRGEKSEWEVRLEYNRLIFSSSY